jgi:hypothetical protein
VSIPALTLSALRLTCLPACPRPCLPCLCPARLQDIMRGISPKQEVPRDSWQVHLANKIKYHWRTPLSECSTEPCSVPGWADGGAGCAVSCLEPFIFCNPL